MMSLLPSARALRRLALVRLLVVPTAAAFGASFAPSSAAAQRPASPASPTSTRRAPDSLRVPILVYHNILPAAEAKAQGIRGADLTMRPEVFAEQMQLLKDRGIAVVSFGDLVDALEGTRTLPARAVVITFDDGRLNQRQHAVPVLRTHGFTATFFPFTHAMDRNPRYFTWAQFRELQAEGHLIGSHTSLHVRVDRMKDAQQMHAEVTGSRERLREKLGEPATRYFSYPFGALAPAGDSAVRAAGYRAARAYAGGSWNSIRNRWRLNAVPMTENMKRFAQIVDPDAPSTTPAKPSSKAPTKSPARTPAEAPATGASRR